MIMKDSKPTSLKDMTQMLGVSIPIVFRAINNSSEISRELCIKDNRNRGSKRYLEESKVIT